MKNIKLQITCLIFSIFLYGCPKTLNNNTSTSTHILQEASKAYNKKNYKRSYLLLMPLAKKDNAIAQYQLGYLYYYGRGTAINYKKAYYWIRKSASQGYKPARIALDIINNNS